ncbi:MAG TPA: hypothetical protein VGE07_27150, partial [Herpetosiphonaceae bacterium]
SALLRSYPFPPEETWFINVPWLGRGSLTLVTGEGSWREPVPDDALLRLFQESHSPTAPLAERRYRGERLDSASLRRRGYRAASLVGLNADGSAAGFRQAGDQFDQLDAGQIATAAILLRRALKRIAEQ